MVRHLLATLIDVTVWSLIGFLGYAGSLSVIYGFETGEDRIVLAYILVYLAMLAYFSAELFGRRTWGKRLMRVTTMLRNGDLPPRRARVLRWSIKCSPWIMSLALSCVASKVPDNFLLNGVLVDYPRTIENIVIQRLYDTIGMEWEILLFPPLSAIRFLAFGMVPLTILAVGELLIFFPPHRTLLDRLSGTMVVRFEKSAGRGFETLPVIRAKAPA